MKRKHATPSSLPVPKRTETLTQQDVLKIDQALIYAISNNPNDRKPAEQFILLAEQRIGFLQCMLVCKTYCYNCKLYFNTQNFFTARTDRLCTTNWSASFG